MIEQNATFLLVGTESTSWSFELEAVKCPLTVLEPIGDGCGWLLLSRQALALRCTRNNEHQNQHIYITLPENGATNGFSRVI